jgi:hypothetical protein
VCHSRAQAAASAGQGGSPPARSIASSSGTDGFKSAEEEAPEDDPKVPWLAEDLGESSSEDGDEVHLLEVEAALTAGARMLSPTHCSGK